MNIIGPLNADFGVAVDGVRLAELASDGPALLDLLNVHGLVAVRGCEFTEEQLVAFSAVFGEVFVHYVGEYLSPRQPAIMYLSNNVVDGKPLGAPNNGIYWHSDQIFRERPLMATLLYGHEVPGSGGNTEFADMRAAFNALDPAMQARLLPLTAVHSFRRSYERNYIRAKPLSAADIAANPDVVHPVVRTHPVTGAQSLFLDPDSVTEIVGLSAAESEALLAQLYDWAFQPRFVYSHAWVEKELVVWDNRCLMHRATSYDASMHRRLMWRTQVKGDRPFQVLARAA